MHKAPAFVVFVITVLAVIGVGVVTHSACRSRSRSVPRPVQPRN